VVLSLRPAAGRSHYRDEMKSLISLRANAICCRLVGQTSFLLSDSQWRHSATNSAPAASSNERTAEQLYASRLLSTLWSCSEVILTESNLPVARACQLQQSCIATFLRNECTPNSRTAVNFRYLWRLQW